MKGGKRMLSLILLILAMLLFGIAGVMRPAPPDEPWRNRMVCFGLAFWVLSELVSRWPGLKG